MGRSFQQELKRDHAAEKLSRRPMVGPQRGNPVSEKKRIGSKRVRLASEQQAFYNPHHPVKDGPFDFDLRIDDEVS